MHLENKIILKCKNVFTRKVRIMVVDEKRGVVVGMRHVEGTSGGMVKFYFFDLGGSLEGVHFAINNSAVNLFV